MRTIYYKDELNDEFSNAVIETKKIDGNYDYEQSGLREKAAHFFWYKIVARPIAWFYLKLRYHHKIVGKNILKNAGKQGYYLYANHTNADADPFIPTMVAYPREVYVVVHPNNVSMPVIGKITPYLGALPLPDDKEAFKHFSKKLMEISQKDDQVVMIYPEAHIWPYYTKIRPFKDGSFRYPLMFDKPVYCFTNTYQKKTFGKGPKIVTYVDGPFVAPGELNHKEKKAYLRDKVYETMCLRSKENSIEIIKYIKVDC